jgi:hypothetical protein
MPDLDRERADLDCDLADVVFPSADEVGQLPGRARQLARLVCNEDGVPCKLTGHVYEPAGQAGKLTDVSCKKTERVGEMNAEGGQLNG